MSQSPTTLESSPTAQRYLSSWARLGELVRRGASFSGRERNRCFLNPRSGQPFVDISSIAGLDHTDDGRGMAVVDWDHDGDLDLWMSNRTGPRVRMMRNDIAKPNHYVAFRLQGVSCNRDAIGARVQLILPPIDEVSRTRVRIKTLRAGEGFLSQSSKWIHFGLGHETKVEEVRVLWPGRTRPQVFKDIDINQRYRLVQGAVSPTLVTTEARGQRLKAKPAVAAPTSQRARTILTRRLPLPDLKFQDSQSRPLIETQNGPLLLNVWASWCAPCVDELSELTKQQSAIQEKSLRVLAVSVDDVYDSFRQASTDQEILSRIKFPFKSVSATKEQLQQLTDLTHQIFYPQKSLSLPCSFLVDSTGKIAAFYRGPVTIDQLLADVDLLTADRQRIAQAAFPFPGRRLLRVQEPSPLSVAEAYLEGGYLQQARRQALSHLEQVASVKDFDRLATVLNESIRPGVIRRHATDVAVAAKHGAPLIEALRTEQRRRLASGWRLLAKIEQERQSPIDREKALRQLVKAEPEDFQAQSELAVVLASQNRSSDADRVIERLRSNSSVAARLALGRSLMQMGRAEEAEQIFEKAVELYQTNVEARFSLAMAKQIAGQAEAAVEQYRRILSEQPDHHQARNNLAWLFATTRDKVRDPEQAVRLARKLCRDTDLKIPEYLDTLAAALSETGDFDAAVQATTIASRLARGSGNEQLATRLERRSALYRSRRPITRWLDETR